MEEIRGVIDEAHVGRSVIPLEAGIVCPAIEHNGPQDLGFPFLKEKKKKKKKKKF